MMALGEDSRATSERPTFYGNFRNPARLVWRMLRSGSRAARGALFRTAAGLGTWPLDLCLQPLESRLIRETEATSLPAILIVGAPRSGTTLLSQVLAQYLDVTYFNNFSSLFPRSPLAASKLFSRFLPTGAADFHNYYGQTARLSAPNDGFHIWNRWFGHDRYQAPNDLDESSIEEMGRYLRAWMGVFQKPLLNKNNRHSACLGLLASAMPEAHFVVVRRETIQVVQSLITARLTVQGNKNHAWGLAARNAAGGDPHAHVDAVCDQVTWINTVLDAQLRNLDRRRFTELSYEDFCGDPRHWVRHLASTLAVTLDEQRVDAELTSFQVSRTLHLTTSERDRIESRLASHGGSHTGRRASAAADKRPGGSPSVAAPSPDEDRWNSHSETPPDRVS